MKIAVMYVYAQMADALGSNKQGNCNCQLKILIWNTVTK